MLHYRHTVVTLSSHCCHTIVTLMVPFERSLSKLSEKHKIFDFRSTEFKLWQLKDSKIRLNGWGGGCLLTAITSVKLIQCQIFYDFLKA